MLAPASFAFRTDAIAIAIVSYHYKSLFFIAYFSFFYTATIESHYTLLARLSFYVVKLSA